MTIVEWLFLTYNDRVPFRYRLVCNDCFDISVQWDLEDFECTTEYVKISYPNIDINYEDCGQSIKCLKNNIDVYVPVILLQKYIDTQHNGIDIIKSLNLFDNDEAKNYLTNHIRKIKLNNILNE